MSGALGLLRRAGAPGRQLAAGADLLRATGPAYAARRVAERRQATRLASTVGDGHAAMWARAANDVGADLVDLGGGFLELSRGGARVRVRGHWVGLDDLVTARLALDKGVVQHLLRAVGVPVPEHARFHRADLDPALAFLARTRGPCFVKPAGGAGGAGATGGVSTPRQLERAVIRAGRRYDELLVERQVPGDVYRLLLLDGELLDVIRRGPPCVTGDGRSTIRRLIAQENRRRFALAGDRGATPWLLTIDLDCVFTLQRSGWALSSIPPAGCRVAVKTAVNANSVEDNERVLGGVAADVVAQARRAAAVVGVRLAGVDVVTPDVMTSLHRAGGAVLEVNATPGLGYHAAVRNPGGVEPVAAQILRRLLETPTAHARDRQATTEGREKDDGRQAEVGGDAAGARVPHPDHLGAP